LAPQKGLYLSLDDILFTSLGLTEIADSFYKGGGELLLLDEVHKYPGWSREIKTIYDRYSKLRIIVTCSSALMLSKGEADLSRRAMVYSLNELSLREFIALKYKLTLPVYSLDQILKEHETIAGEVRAKIKPIMAFNEYLQFGAYPFFMHGEESYLSKLQQAVQTVIENDLPALENVSYGTVVRLRKLLGIIAGLVPFKPNISELSEKLGVSRDQLLRLLHLLELGDIIYQLKSDAGGMSFLAKPEKIYLHNPNIAAAITHTRTETGTNRETFLINQLSALHKVYYPREGDFRVDDKIILEVGGKNKTRKQIRQTPNAWLLKDGIEYGKGNTVPLWLFGFSY
jgi:uncharacterized protein